MNEGTGEAGEWQGNVKTERSAVSRSLSSFDERGANISWRRMFSISDIIAIFGALFNNNLSITSNNSDAPQLYPS